MWPKSLELLKICLSPFDIIIESSKNLRDVHTTLLTYPNQTNTSGKINGLSGGEILIEAEEAEGQLFAKLSGQNGKNGIEPPGLGDKGRGKPV